MNSCDARRRLVILFASLAAAALSIGAPQAPASTARRPRTSYHWPVRPFDRAAPRAGELRRPADELRRSGPLPASLMSERRHRSGSTSGLTSPSRDGTAVYPVSSGIVRPSAAPASCAVNSAGELRHRVLASRAVAVRTGQHVVAYRTVLGHVMQGLPARALHASSQRGRSVEPARARATSRRTRDRTAPRRGRSIVFRSAREPGGAPPRERVRAGRPRRRRPPMSPARRCPRPLARAAGRAGRSHLADRSGRATDAVVVPTPDRLRLPHVAARRTPRSGVIYARGTRGRT